MNEHKTPSDLKSSQPSFPQATVHSLIKFIFIGLEFLRQWLDTIEINNRKLARFVCKLIPVQCPFARDINFLGRTIAHIPPLCKLNPFYEQLVGLRFRAACYLVEQCGESV
jgi:hypothetical protein